LTYKTEMPSH